MSTPSPLFFPLLESLLADKGLPLQGAYTIGDAARVFSVSKRAIQHWVKRGRLQSRNLPGRVKFLAADLETFLSVAKR